MTRRPEITCRGITAEEIEAALAAAFAAVFARIGQRDG